MTPKVICSAILTGTCKETVKCCPHRVPHVHEEIMCKDTRMCRYTEEENVRCVPVPANWSPGEVVKPVEEKPAPSQQPVEIVKPPEPVEEKKDEWIQPEEPKTKKPVPAKKPGRKQA